MSREAKLLLKVAGVIAALGVLLVLTAGAVVYRSGVLMVQVHEKKPGGAHVVVPIPAALVSAGIAFIPQEDLGRVRGELKRYQPIVQSICDELANSPDGPLVEVTGPKQKIRVV